MAPQSSSSATTSVQVALRIRPTTAQDSTNIPARFQRSVLHATSTNSVAVEGTSSAPPNAGSSSAVPAASSSAASKKQVFSFDQVHGPSTTQHAMFTSTAQPLISRFIEGFNCTILAYGQTSSGKTFTMTGMDLDADPSDPGNGMGIIPRAVSTIFSRARQLKEERGTAWNYSIKGSFIEIYNEDLIDLLSMDDTAGGRREVQIREDKDGHIIWGGLREVNVKNSGEVMNLIRKGTSIRRTNETDMNAQSSRSHAIFSLTLTQKKYTGSGAPPRSSSPLPPGGRSPSRLARPGSVYSSNPSGSRVASPTFGRPSTPSFAAAMGRGGGLRPTSALGHAADRAMISHDDEAGEWVTIVSKFHFVDLAGSERLKRTAAAGERIKEGISINSGLLALGNVISALGDPSRAKSHTATHVPYRDSKLTRLLQDSLGGNAHTLMIACVSAAEYNVGETINTLKYANRARNIKNRAVVNEKEDGWDDIEWLQGTVTRLRRELKSIKEGGNGIVGEVGGPDALEGAGRKVLAQMTELQNNYEDLREKFVERTEELTRLRRELGEKHRGSSAGAIGGTAKYEEIVGPVIEEYEKTIAAMEAELNLNRAALRHTNEMVEEKEEELSAVTERHAATELYVEELRARVAKLTEREASTEAYVRDLEEKMKAYDETSITSSESMTDLKREVARFKDSESHSTKYIADLEARLARSDESILALQQTVENLEQEVERRRDEVESLQTRLQVIRQDGEGWRNDLEERERKVRELETKMQEWERKKKDAGDTRARLGSVVDEVALARHSLDIDFKNAAPSLQVNGESEENPDHVNGISLAALEASPSPSAPVTPPETAETDQSLHNQFVALQQTHTATLADLSSVTAKYRDALREISDLAAQIQEAKLSNSVSSESLDSPTTTDKSMELSPMRRRIASRTREASEPQYNAAGRRLFFRQAASAESLHSRSLSQSQSLSQELSSVHSRKTSFSSLSSHSHSHSRSNSNSTSTLNSLLQSSRPNLSISVPNGVPNHAERSVSSLEMEIMRLQDVLKEREVEISVLENSLKQSRDDQSAASSSALATPADEISEILPKVNGPSSVHLSPKTMGHFDHIRRSMENANGHPVVDLQDSESERNGSSVISESDESLERLNELMLSMAQKESHHREVVDTLNEQLTQLRRQHDELTTLSRDQALNMSSEIENLRSQYDHDLRTLDEVQKREAELSATLEQAIIDHAAAIEEIRVQYAEALKAKQAEIDDLLSRFNTDETSSSSLRNELVAVSATLEQVHRDHESRLQEANEILSRTKDEHEAAIRKIIAEHEELIKQNEAQSSSVLHKTEEDYYNVLTKLRRDHAVAMEKQSADAAAALERLKEAHAGELRMAEIAREGSLSESQSSSAIALQGLQEEHSAAMARKQASFAEELELLKAEHARALVTQEEDYQLQMDKIRSEQEGVLMKLKEEWRVEGERLNSTIIAIKEEAASSASVAAANASTELDAAVKLVKEQQATVLQEFERGHEAEILRLNAAHSSALEDLEARAADKHAALVQSHTEEILKLKSDHQRSITELNASIVALEEHYTAALEDARVRSEQELEEERERLAATLDDLKAQHDAELDVLRKDHELLAEEAEAQKIAAEEFALLREESRESHEQAMEEKTALVSEMQQQMSIYQDERDELAVEVSKLRAELDKTKSEQSKLIQEASKRESLVGELERHRSVLAEMQENLQKVKDEKDTLQVEKNRSETLLRELQAQLARSGSPPNARPPTDRTVSYNRGNGLPPMKLPPPTPPPSVPPPPAPRSHDAVGSVSSQASSAVTSSSSSRESQLDSPSTSIGPGSVNNIVPSAKLEQQAKLIDEQEAMIKTLNKQLTHCESDLQTHMDLVSTLETSLGDSEKNLRKARMHATELARERDTLNTKLEGLRNELVEAKREVVNVRRSIVEEKQSYEQRLDEERKAKERARQQLDSRMDELASKRKSKFACL
ncbi:kinesin domain-containing protein [Desarmillaria tabescens]|uniref:Kinesin domain-containing protein n=1 Tax=Armillaria tabescens TaxID=1929756 RepID=A0AA39NDK4_ARMTA|nr:kinesin domain-containing protein [Desarmillaria tabescens]KAK0463641.1 kinesin domain-containing protein [Desarmillaria tabescens]